MYVVEFTRYLVNLDRVLSIRLVLDLKEYQWEIRFINDTYMYTKKFKTEEEAVRFIENKISSYGKFIELTNGFYLNMENVTKVGVVKDTSTGKFQAQFSIMNDEVRYSRRFDKKEEAIRYITENIKCVCTGEEVY